MVPDLVQLGSDLVPHGQTCIFHWRGCQKCLVPDLVQLGSDLVPHGQTCIFHWRGCSKCLVPDLGSTRPGTCQKQAQTSPEPQMRPPVQPEAEMSQNHRFVNRSCNRPGTHARSWPRPKLLPLLRLRFHGHLRRVLGPPASAASRSDQPGLVTSKCLGLVTSSPPPSSVPNPSTSLGPASIPLQAPGPTLRLQT